MNHSEDEMEEFCDISSDKIKEFMEDRPALCQFVENSLIEAIALFELDLTELNIAKMRGLFFANLLLGFKLYRYENGIKK